MKSCKLYIPLGASLASMIIVFPSEVVFGIDSSWKFAGSLLITFCVFSFLPFSNFDRLKSFALSTINSILLFYLFSFHVLAISLFLGANEFDYKTRDFVFLVLMLQMGTGLLVLCAKYSWKKCSKGQL